MKLSVLERLVTLQLFPAEDDNVTWKVIRRGKMELSFSEEEIKKYKFEEIEVDTPGGKKKNTKWDSTVEQDTEVKLGSKVISLISDKLEELNKEKKLDEIKNVLYEKFCKDDV